MAKPHSPGFLKIVEEARQRVPELSIEEVKAKLEGGENFRLIDVREGEEHARGHLPGAESLCKGIIERDIEERVPNHETPIVLYCGGGYRSALAADNLKKMGYKNVWSMWGGWRAWSEAGFPTEK
ncbi:MAG TPA: rhodanese-like domain-containing protein [Candidatus Xenobia bacterium]|nr:rhodanese-like domain-containing protein [Candidatus Xenobia bacterium]